MIGVCFMSHTTSAQDSAASRKKPPAKTARPVRSDPANDLVTAQIKLGLDIFREIVDQQPGNNVFISPLSINLALLMAHHGAAGKTKEEIGRTLGIGGQSEQTIRQSLSVFKEFSKNKKTGVDISIANSFWIRKEIPLQQTFIETALGLYNAEVESLRFDDPGAFATINSWVSKKTKQKITQIMGTIDQNAAAFILNAVYFKGQWSAQFDPGATRIKSFMLGNGTKKSHPMMFQSGSYSYYENERMQAALIPYEEGRIGMIIFLPKDNVSLAELYKNLDARHWKEWLSRFNDRNGAIILPRFKMEYAVRLDGILKTRGMNDAFDHDKADFKNMVMPIKQWKFWIQEVKHKTFIKVNEEGTQAAAASYVAASLGESDHPQPFSMIVNRPFFFAIEDNKTGILLFLGSITDPNE